LTAVSTDVEQQLAWEARHRPRAGGAAIAAAILSVGSLIWMQEALKDLPRAGFLSSLAQAFKPGPVGEQPSLLAPVFQYYVDHGATFIAISVLQAIGYLLMAWLLTFLGAAARARRPEMPKLGIYVALVGAVLLAASVILGEIGRSTAFPAFLDSSRSLAQQFLAGADEEPTQWQEAASLTNTDLWLSVEEARELAVALAAALEPYRGRTLGDRHDDTRRVRVTNMIVPHRGH